MPSDRPSRVGFRLAYSEPTLAYSKCQSGRWKGVSPNITYPCIRAHVRAVDCAQMNTHRRTHVRTIDRAPMYTHQHVRTIDRPPMCTRLSTYTRVRAIDRAPMCIRINALCACACERRTSSYVRKHPAKVNLHAITSAIIVFPIPRRRSVRRR